jgi:hypothetical protein
VATTRTAGIGSGGAVADATRRAGEVEARPAAFRAVALGFAALLLRAGALRLAALLLPADAFVRAALLPVRVALAMAPPPGKASQGARRAATGEIDRSAPPPRGRNPARVRSPPPREPRRRTFGHDPLVRSVADRLKDEDRARIAALSPEARVALSLRLAEAAIGVLCARRGCLAPPVSRAAFAAAAAGPPPRHPGDGAYEEPYFAAARSIGVTFIERMLSSASYAAYL